MRVLIADDHPFVLRGMREILAGELGLRDIVEAGDGRTAYDRLVSEQFDLAVIDVAMPGKNGLELMKDVLSVRPQTPFLVVSVYTEQEMAGRAYECGAKGYLCKARPIPEFVEAVRTILRGNTYMDPEFAQCLVDKLRAPQGKSGLDALTTRELAVLHRYGAGKSLTAIGAELGISMKTVSTHKSRIMKKLACRTNADLVAFALAHGLVPSANNRTSPTDQSGL